MLVERPLRRVVNGVVRLHVSDQFEADFRREIVTGVPFVYSNHHGHIDGFAYAVLTEYLCQIASETPGAFPLKGLAMPIAKSFIEGQQGLGPRLWYHFFNSTLRSMGYLTLPATREVDGKYGMSRDGVVGEILPIARLINKGYGMALLPEGTVQGGRHPEGAGVEDIYGMQQIKDDYLKEFSKIALKMAGRSDRGIFFVQMGVDGSYRLQYSPENVQKEGPPRVTKEGLRAFKQAFLGQDPEVWIDARVNRLITVDELIHKLGNNWLEDGARLSDDLMAQVLPSIPERVWGEYGRRIQHLTRTLELTTTS